MKKTNSILIAAIVMILATVSAIAKDAPVNTGLAVVQVKDSDVFKVIYKGESTGKVKLNIYNSQDQVIFAETFVADGFILPVNFSGLQNGEYTIELVDAAGKKSEKISVGTVKSVKNIHLAKISEEGKYLLANNLLHSETRDINGDFAQVYAMKNVNGPVTFEISDSTGIAKTVRY
jgi:hypothetical protein